MFCILRLHWRWQSRLIETEPMASRVMDLQVARDILHFKSPIIEIEKRFPCGFMRRSEVLQTQIDGHNREKMGQIVQSLRTPGIRAIKVLITFSLEIKSLAVSSKAINLKKWLHFIVCVYVNPRYFHEIIMADSGWAHPFCAFILMDALWGDYFHVGI
jgi:hypothetical protein